MKQIGGVAAGFRGPVCFRSRSRSRRGLAPSWGATNFGQAYFKLKNTLTKKNFRNPSSQTPHSAAADDNTLCFFNVGFIKTGFFVARCFTGTQRRHGQHRFEADFPRQEADVKAGIFSLHHATRESERAVVATNARPRALDLSRRQLGYEFLKTSV